jgi:1-acyl-sn-glycerol-3-phosphate acyltransferase
MTKEVRMTQRSLLSRCWYQFLRMGVQIIGMLMFGVRIHGQKNIPAEGGVLVVSNHQSHLDPPLVGLGSRRRMNYLARETLFGFAPFRWLIKSLDAIPLDREGLGLAGLKESLRRLKRGEMVLMFPEGTRTPDGQIHSFKPGFTSLAVRSRAAILPVAIEGAFKCWPKKHTFPRPGKIRVLYGQPILPEEYEGLDERKLLTLVENRVRLCREEILSRWSI